MCLLMETIFRFQVMTQSATCSKQVLFFKLLLIHMQSSTHLVSCFLLCYGFVLKNTQLGLRTSHIRGYQISPLGDGIIFLETDDSYIKLCVLVDQIQYKINRLFHTYSVLSMAFLVYVTMMLFCQVLKAFHYPMTVTLVQFAVGSVLVLTMWTLNLYKRPKISGAQVLL